jgi:hypothetical protein
MDGLGGRRMAGKLQAEADGGLILKRMGMKSGCGGAERVQARARAGRLPAPDMDLFA